MTTAASSRTLRPAGPGAERIAVVGVPALAAARAEAMDAASGPDHGPAGIRGLPQARIAAMAEARGCHLAIRNAPDSAVIGGPTGSLDAICRDARPVPSAQRCCRCRHPRTRRC